MRIAKSLANSLALSLAIAAGGSLAFADDTVPHPRGDSAPPRTKTAEETIVFGDGAATFVVTRHTPDGYVFRLQNPSTQLARPPVVVIGDRREVALVPVEGQQAAWRFPPNFSTSGSLRGSMRIAVGDRTLAQEIDLVPAWRPVHGGALLPLRDCGFGIEVVHDGKTGLLTLYAPEGTTISGPPAVTLTGPQGATAGPVAVAEVRPGVWTVTHAAFKGYSYTGTIRLVVNGTPCTAPITYLPTRSGRVLSVNGGPTFEVVREADSGAYTFYALDDTIDGKAYVVERPEFVYTTPEGPRTVVLTPVEGQPRAWRLVGLGAGTNEYGDASLRFTLFGKTLETAVGPSGLGINLR